MRQPQRGDVLYMEEKSSRTPASQTVWLNEQARIASFHHVVGCEKRSFTCHAFFMGFLHDLQEQGYRFQ